MKKLVLACILFSGFFSLQAQTLQLKPKDFSNPMEKYLKPFTNSKPDSYKLLTPKLNLDEALAVKEIPLESQPFSSNMPVVKLDGYDNMPVAKPDGYDNMPILGFDSNKAKKLKQAQTY